MSLDAMVSLQVKPTRRCKLSRLINSKLYVNQRVRKLRSFVQT